MMVAMERCSTCGIVTALTGCFCPATSGHVLTITVPDDYYNVDFTFRFTEDGIKVEGNGYMMTIPLDWIRAGLEKSI